MTPPWNFRNLVAQDPDCVSFRTKSVITTASLGPAVGALPMGIQVLGQPHTDARCAAYARWMLKTLTPVVV
jgi:hypothetical protein